MTIAEYALLTSATLLYSVEKIPYPNTRLSSIVHPKLRRIATLDPENTKHNSPRSIYITGHSSRRSRIFLIVVFEFSISFQYI